jgi:sialate O-acetylesterase
VKKPVAIRYCFKNFQIGNLKNAAGLPLFPFRTDNW